MHYKVGGLYHAQVGGKIYPKSGDRVLFRVDKISQIYHIGSYKGVRWLGEHVESVRSLNEVESGSSDVSFVATPLASDWEIIVEDFARSGKRYWRVNEYHLRESWEVTFEDLPLFISYKFIYPTYREAFK